MASSSKKRRGSKAPDRFDTSKRVRRRGSIHSQCASSYTSRGKPVYRGDSDPYFPKQHDSASLPISEDWAFRIQVISSSSTDLDNNVFKNAVQGLVKICFPQGVLEELGVEVLEQHMRESCAPEDNIARMKEIFRSEMIYRMTWMLAEYLDSSASVDDTVQAIIASCAKLHGKKLGRDVLGDTIASLHRLRERVPDDSTKRLAQGGILQGMPEREAIDDSRELVAVDGPDSNSTSVSSLSGSPEKGPAPPPPKKASKSDPKCMSKTEKCGVIQRHGNDVDISGFEIDTPTVPAESIPDFSGQPRRDNVISKKWDWNISSGTVALEAVPEHFGKTSDLFAYHALPVAQARLGPNATKKELRHEMQSMLEDMQAEEYEKWIQSYQKLLDGDMEMLVRPELLPELAVCNRQRTTTTPAPIDTRKRMTNASKKSIGSSNSRVGDKNSVRALLHNTIQITRESNANANTTDLSQAEAQQDSMVAAITALQHSSTEGLSIRPLVYNVEDSAEHRVKGLHASSIRREICNMRSTSERGNLVQKYLTTSRTPIVDLLLESPYLHLDELEGAKFKIMQNFRARVTIDSIWVAEYNEATRDLKKETFATLETHILRYRRTRSRVSTKDVKKDMEKRFAPWVLASPASFPELLEHEVMFTRLMPFATPVLDACCDPSIQLTKECLPLVKAAFTVTLHQRGLSKMDPREPETRELAKSLPGIVSDSDLDVAVKRHRLETLLRPLAFGHKDRFRDLKDSSLVKTWEQMTGLSW